MIDNSARKAPAQFNDHETLDVTRRIERESGSTYRINGREVRARDVHILFADASTGSRSPALVHQGRIGEIIQAKPEQRRRVLEEAAGISGLHARRHEAELRLRAAVFDSVPAPLSRLRLRSMDMVPLATIMVSSVSVWISCAKEYSRRRRRARAPGA